MNALSKIHRLLNHISRDFKLLLNHANQDVLQFKKIFKSGKTQNDQKVIDLAHLAEVVNRIRTMTESDRKNLELIEFELIPFIGLNNEQLHEQPIELSINFGTGLHLWQYPNQFSRLLAEIASDKELRGYLEVGSRWGGTFVVMSEWLYWNSPKKNFFAVAIDIIDEPPIIQEYRKYCAMNGGPQIKYLKGASNSRGVLDTLKEYDFGTVFIDGDHTTEGVILDHSEFTKDVDRVIHHDIDSDAVPNLRTFWSAIKQIERNKFDFTEFTNQYKSVSGSFLGIGLMRNRRNLD
jgi:hypothetical protein